MCLAIPGKVVEIKRNLAKVDFGGVIREVDLSLVDINVGDYVLVHAGFAIETIDEEEAERSLDLWRELLEEEETQNS
ncbi:MAG: [NiFe] hydrogenase metallocenter assembly protein HypC [Candidatus Methanolliviera sp. GoM_oil]|nr:MAG: [NiFe] hydrogenase metallocenter assembly protein HypC [Candidatus Methanolliviera sp. GoM_oil]